MVKQTDNYNCGVHTIAFLLEIFRSKDENNYFGDEEHMSLYRKQIEVWIRSKAVTSDGKLPTSADDISNCTVPPTSGTLKKVVPATSRKDKATATSATSTGKVTISTPTKSSCHPYSTRMSGDKDLKQLNYDSKKRSSKMPGKTSLIFTDNDGDTDDSSENSMLKYAKIWSSSIKDIKRKEANEKAAETREANKKRKLESVQE